jgi:hypothetical protein
MPTLSQQIFDVLNADRDHVFTVRQIFTKLKTTKAAVVEALENGLSHIVDFDHENQTVCLRDDLDEETVEETLGSAESYPSIEDTVDFNADEDELEPLNEPGEDEDEDENFGSEDDDEGAAHEPLLAEQIATSLANRRAAMVEDGLNPDDPASWADEEDEEDDPEPTFRFPSQKRQEYATKGGNCGDDLAQALTAALNVTNEDGKGTRIDEGALNEIASENHIPVVRGSNPGQRRMNLANMLRGKLRKGETVYVLGTPIKGDENPPLDRMKLLRSIAQGYETETGANKKQARILAEQELDAKIEGGLYEVLSKGKLRKVAE